MFPKRINSYGAKIYYPMQEICTSLSKEMKPIKFHKFPNIQLLPLPKEKLLSKHEDLQFRREAANGKLRINLKMRNVKCPTGSSSKIS